MENITSSASSHSDLSTQATLIGGFSLGVALQAQTRTAVSPLLTV
jgi:hypothetical protein